MSFVIEMRSTERNAQAFPPVRFCVENAAFAFLFFYELSYKYAIMKRCIFLIEVQYD